MNTIMVEMEGGRLPHSLLLLRVFFFPPFPSYSCLGSQCHGCHGYMPTIDPSPQATPHPHPLNYSPKFLLSEFRKRNRGSWSLGGLKKKETSHRDQLACHLRHCRGQNLLFLRLILSDDIFLSFMGTQGQKRPAWPIPSKLEGMCVGRRELVANFLFFSREILELGFDYSPHAKM